MRVYAALEKISGYDDKELPPFIIPLKNLVLKVSNLVNDIKTDVIGFCNVRCCLCCFCFGLVQIGLVQIGLVQIGLVQIGLVWRFRSVC